MCLLAVFGLFAVCASPSQAHSAQPKQIYLGKEDAPVTLQEFASFTCSHCGAFKTNIFPEIEKKYIETGKLRYIFRDFPIDGIALKASALTHCMPDDQYYPLVKVLFKNMDQWAFGKTPEQTIIQYAKLGGLSEDKANACLKDTNLFDAIVAGRALGQEKYNITSTPTFIFNDGQEKIVGALKLEDYEAVIERLLDKAKTATNAATNK